METTQLKKILLSADMMDANQVSSYIEDKLKNITTDYTSFEVFPTDKTIPAKLSTLDALNIPIIIQDKITSDGIVEVGGLQVHYVSIAEHLGWDQNTKDLMSDTCTGLDYTNEVVSCMTAGLGLYNYSVKADCNIIIDWGDGTVENVKDLTVIDPTTIPTVDGKYNLDGLNGLIFYDPISLQNAYSVIQLVHTYSAPIRYTVKVYGKYFCIRSCLIDGLTPIYNLNKYSLMSSLFGTKYKLSKQVRNVSSMAKNCIRLLKVEINNDLIDNISNASNMFYVCENLLNVNFSSQNTFLLKSSVINGMFGYCSNLETITNFKMPLNQIYSLTGGSYKEMYMNDFKLTTDVLALLPPNGFSTKYVKMGDTFRNCYNLSCSDYIRLANILWNDSNVIFADTSKTFKDSGLDLSLIPSSWGGTASDSIITKTNYQLQVENQNINVQLNTINEFMLYCFNGVRLLKKNASGDIVNVLIPDDELSSNVYQYKSNDTIDNDLIEVVKLGSSITSIGDNCFNNCKELTSVNTSKAETVGISSFNGCTKLTKLTTKVSVDNYSDTWGIDLYIENPDNFTLKNNEKIIDYYQGNVVLLSNESGYHLENYYNNSTTQIDNTGAWLRAGSNNEVKKVYNTSQKITEIVAAGYTNPVFGPRSNLSSFKSNTITRIVNSGAFYNNLKLVEVDMPELSVITAGNTFCACINLTNVNLPKLTTVPESTFNRCNSLVSISLPAVKTLLWQMAMSNCQNLKYIYFGNAITSIGTKSFITNSKLEFIKFGSELSKIPTITADAFDTSYTNKVIMYVPDNLVASWKLAANWSTFYNNGIIDIVGLSEFSE